MTTTPGPKGQPQVDALSAPTFSADLTAVANYAALLGNHMVGTSAERGALTSETAWPGLLFDDVSDGRLYRRNSANNGWERVLRFSHGLFAGGTSETGTVTVSHGLPATPVNVFTTDWQSGAAAYTRKILPNSVSTLQIQFVIINGGQPLPGNPVVFSWLALY